MAQANSADVPLKIGDKTYTLRFSVKAQLALKDQWGLEKDKDLIARLNNLESNDVIDVFWAACRSHHPDLSRDEVIDILDDAEQADYEDAMRQVLVASQPPRDETNSGKKKTPAKKQN